MVLDLALSGAGAADATTTTSDPNTAGVHSDADALVSYKRREGRTTLGVTARSVLRYAATGTTLTPLREQGGLDFAFAGSRDLFRVREDASYSSYYQFGAVPDAGISALGATAQSHGDFANSNLTAFGSATTVDWTRTVSRRFAVSASYDLRRTTFNQPNLDQTSQGVGMGLARRLTRSVSLRLGYAYQAAVSAIAGPGLIVSHDLGLGFDYSREMTGSRRTTFSVRSGASVTPLSQGTAVNVTGSAELTRPIGRTGGVRVAFNRTVQPLEGFGQPVLINAVNSTIMSALGRRASVASSAGYTSGTGGLGSSGSTYSTWTGAVSLRMTLTRRSAFEAQYFWYGQRYAGDFVVAPGLANGLSRNGPRVGITWRAPLVGHLRGQ